MIDDDWGNVGELEWGSAPVKSEMIKQASVENTSKATKKSTNTKGTKKKKIAVLLPQDSTPKNTTSDDPPENVIQMAKKVKKTRKNKYKTEDGRVLGRIEFLELKKKEADQKKALPKVENKVKTAGSNESITINQPPKKTKKKKKSTKNEGELPEKMRKTETQNDDSPKQELDENTKELTERDIELLRRKEARQDLRVKLQNQLKAAEFRFLNEKLYRSEKSDKVLDDESAKIYHEGFSRQVQRWPVNPVSVLIKHIRKRVPRKHVIADLGCGDAKIAASVQNQVHSFDLIQHNERVTACDIRKVPLEDDSVDVSVFCLSLMATDTSQFIMEANRILRLGGKLLIAEVTSRIENQKNFVKTLGSYGFTLERDDKSNSHFVLFFFKKFRESKDIKNRPPVLFRPCQYKKR